jgi:hypothetical protein
MRRTRDDIARIHAPAEAGRLKQLLVDFYDADASLAHESTLLAEFVPASTAALQPLTSTGRSLTRELRAATTAAAQEKALERYRTRVARVVAALQPLHPPPLLLNRHHQEIDHLGKVRSLAQQIVTALRGRDSARVSRLLARFKTLNSRSSTGALPRDAMTAYNKRYLGVRKAFQAVQRERLRLERTL